VRSEDHEFYALLDVRVFLLANDRFRERSDNH
jgi:hypothetical protein